MITLYIKYIIVTLMTHTDKAGVYTVQLYCIQYKDVHVYTAASAQ